MYWPDTNTGVDVEPTRKPVASAVRKFFTEGGAGEAPTVPGGDWFNQITNELLNVLAAAGIEPSKVDDDQLLLAIRRLSLANKDTVASMVSDTSLSVGDRVRTYRYNAEGVMDWEIVTSSDIDSHYLVLANGLFAKLVIGDHVDPIGFGAFNTIDELTGIAQGYSDSAFAEAQTVAKTIKKPVFHGAGIYRLSSDYLIKVKTDGIGKESCTILFDEGFGFKTYQSALVRYFIPEITGIRFEVDKESHWNEVSAGPAYVPGISKYLVRLKYGQRVAKGNKTSTPNNILALSPQDQQDGTGFWNKDYSQWMQAAGVEVDLSHVPLIATNDSCRLFTNDYRKIVQLCDFVGFTHGLVLSGVTQIPVENCGFTTCYVGINAYDSTYTGGSSASRTTTAGLGKNLFEDVEIGIYAHTLLQSDVFFNVFQPATCGIYVGDGGAAGTTIAKNYFEIGHTFIYHKPNLAMRGVVDHNFTNPSYTRYLAWCNNGQELNFTGPQAAQVIHMNAGVQKSYLDSRFLLEVDPAFFVNNGNVIDGGKPKECIIRTVGNGSSFSISTLWSNITTASGAPLTPSFTPSQAGLLVNVSGKIRVLSVEMMDGYASYSYFDANGSTPQSRSTYFFRSMDNVAIDLRENGVTHTLKISWMEL
ncbi:hypothetical protein [Aeromonas caviae]|uniref:hypothetical protein n=1 Tax=Aeromonas caviae TaxID=648 RepID=UPI002B46D925|nr:hypothetical protein [Aeromonas caviae]